VLEVPVQALEAVGIEWASLKMLVERSLDVSHDALHVIAGVVVQLLLAWMLSTSLARWRPWLIVLGLEIANELNDFRVEIWPDFAMQLGEAVKDVLLTLLLPTVLLVVARRKPELFSPQRPTDT
jgi:hypothetical protein